MSNTKFYQVMWVNDQDNVRNIGAYYPTKEEGINALKADLEARKNEITFFVGRLMEREFYIPQHLLTEDIVVAQQEFQISARSMRLSKKLTIF